MLKHAAFCVTTVVCLCCKMQQLSRESSCNISLQWQFVSLLTEEYFYKTMQLKHAKYKAIKCHKFKILVFMKNGFISLKNALRLQLLGSSPLNSPAGLSPCTLAGAQPLLPHLPPLPSDPGDATGGDGIKTSSVRIKRRCTENERKVWVFFLRYLYRRKNSIFSRSTVFNGPLWSIIQNITIVLKEITDIHHCVAIYLSFSPRSPSISASLYCTRSVAVPMCIHGCKPPVWSHHYAGRV